MTFGGTVHVTGVDDPVRHHSLGEIRLIAGLNRDDDMPGSDLLVIAPGMVVGDAVAGESVDDRLECVGSASQHPFVRVIVSQPVNVTQNGVVTGGNDDLFLPEPNPRSP